MATVTADVFAMAEAALYGSGPGAPVPDSFKLLSRTGDVEIRPKEAMIIRFDGEHYPKPEGDRISLIPINDIHYGSLSCNREKFEEYLDYILKSPDTYTTGVGDLIENATKFSVGMAMYEETSHLPDQLEYIAEKLRPLVKAKKIFGLQPGNHEYRLSVLSGLDPMAILAKWLEIPYLGWQAYWSFDVDGERYKALTYHGAGGSVTKGGKLNNVRKMKEIMADADIYVMGHVHDLIHDFDEFNTITDDGEIVRKRRHYVVAGSLLSYFGGYPEMAGFAPSPMGLARIDMFRNRHEVQVHM